MTVRYGFIAYQFNKAELEDMEYHVPMTPRERTAIRSWVKRGHTVESNPWEHRDSSGELMNDHRDNLKEKQPSRQRTTNTA